MDDATISGDRSCDDSIMLARLFLWDASMIEYIDRTVRFGRIVLDVPISSTLTLFAFRSCAFSGDCKARSGVYMLSE